MSTATTATTATTERQKTFDGKPTIDDILEVKTMLYNARHDLGLACKLFPPRFNVFKVLCDQISAWNEDLDKAERELQEEPIKMRSCNQNYQD